MLDNWFARQAYFTIAANGGGKTSKPRDYLLLPKAPKGPDLVYEKIRATKQAIEKLRGY